MIFFLLGCWLGDLYIDRWVISNKIIKVGLFLILNVCKGFLLMDLNWNIFKFKWKLYMNFFFIFEWYIYIESIVLIFNGNEIFGDIDYWFVFRKILILMELMREMKVKLMLKWWRSFIMYMLNEVVILKVMNWI